MTTDTTRDVVHCGRYYPCRGVRRCHRSRNHYLVDFYSRSRKPCNTTARRRIVYILSKLQNNMTQQTDPKESENKMALGKKNLIMMAIGVVVIILGFALMAGGGSDDPNVFNYEMFNFRRITLAPILVIGGFAFEIYAIMKK